ncbi:DUF1464 family protein [Ktedonobacteria bacterium brp13]|nr:DUF1464 family protein [Ktedonobacteria bacterium brp13]
MPISIGIDYAPPRWSCCLADDETIIERNAFKSAAALLRHLEQLCSLYPEAVLMLALPLEIERQTLHDYLMRTQVVSAVKDDPLPLFLATISEFSQQIYLVPAVQHLPHIPVHRQLLRPTLGTSTTFCMLVSLVHFMRQQEATWTEMNFSLLSLSAMSYTLLVVKNGRVVDGTGERLLQRASEQTERAAIQQAILEQLTYDLAGIMSVHQLEDVVLLVHPEVSVADEAEEQAGEEQDQQNQSYQEKIINHFSDLYQFFLYPMSEKSVAGFEAAQGAALLAQGLGTSGLAVELSRYLFPSSSSCARAM